MAAPKASVLDASAKKAKDVSLDEGVFTAELKPHLIHEVVRAESAAARAGTAASKSRGLVAGGRAKPWRQKGTGRARSGTIRGPQFTGGGHAFRIVPRSYTLKVNRKARKAALRSALSRHVTRDTLAVLGAKAFEEPSTKSAAGFVSAWGKDMPLLVLAQPDEVAVARSFRNLPRVLVLAPSELEVGALIWARSVVATESALDQIQEVARS
jgi:large subunit ribosomal protein L4